MTTQAPAASAREEGALGDAEPSTAVWWISFGVLSLFLVAIALVGALLLMS